MLQQHVNWRRALQANRCRLEVVREDLHPARLRRYREAAIFGRGAQHLAPVGNDLCPGNRQVARIHNGARDGARLRLPTREGREQH